MYRQKAPGKLWCMLLVQIGQPADAAGIQVGDRVTAIGRLAIKPGMLTQAMKQIKDAKGQLKLYIERPKRKAGAVVPMELPKPRAPKKTVNIKLRGLAIPGADVSLRKTRPGMFS